MNKYVKLFLNFQTTDTAAVFLHRQKVDLSAVPGMTLIYFGDHYFERLFSVWKCIKRF